MTSENPWIIDTTDATFDADVMERSRQVPVVVDFWAEWCGPCRMLGPILEKLANESAGKFILAKAETDHNQLTAGRLGVSSIPAVFGFSQGRVKDQFVGVLPEEQLKQWLARLEPSDAERLISEAAGLAPSDRAAAERKYRQALMLEPEFSPALLGLAELMLADDRLDEVELLLGGLPALVSMEAPAQTLTAQLRLKRLAHDAGPLDNARARLAADPADHRARWAVARAAAGLGRTEEALEACLKLVEQDRHGLGEDARHLMVDLLATLGDDSDMATQFRRKLSMALY